MSLRIFRILQLTNKNVNTKQCKNTPWTRVEPGGHIPNVKKESMTEHKNQEDIFSWVKILVPIKILASWVPPKWVKSNAWLAHASRLVQLFNFITYLFQVYKCPPAHITNHFRVEIIFEIIILVTKLTDEISLFV